MQIFDWTSPAAKKRREKKRRQKDGTTHRSIVKKIKDQILRKIHIDDLAHEVQPLQNTRRGIFLVSNKERILIQFFPNGLEKNKEYFQDLCKKKKYQYFSAPFDPVITRLINQLEDYINSFRSFIKEKSIELNNSLPKSEVWFKNKLESENVFKYFAFEYNKPFKKFIYDVYSKRYNVVIEVDGAVHDNPEQQAKDKEKNRLTAMYGYKIIRVEAYNEKSYNKCIQELKAILNKGLPEYKPSPKTIRRSIKQDEFSTKIAELEINKKLGF